MANEGDHSYSRGIHLERAYMMMRDNAILELQEQVRMLTRELEQARGSVPSRQRGHYSWEFYVSPIDIAYSSSYEDYDYEDRGVKGRRHTRR